MGTEVTSMMVVFIGAVAAAGVASAAIVGVVGDMTFEFREQGTHIAEAMGTDLNLVNDPQNVPYDDGASNLTLYVKNTGSRALVANETSVFVDGRFRNFTADLLGSADRWVHGTVMALYVDVDLASGDHRAKVVHTPSVSDVMDFRT